LHNLAIQLKDDEIYTILGEPKPEFLTDDLLRPIARLIQYFPIENRHVIRDAVVNAMEKIYIDKVSESDEMSTILVEMISKEIKKEG
jgi:hypothetical protein